MGSRRQQVANRRTHRFSDTSDNSDRLSKLQHLFIGSPNKSLVRSKVTAAAEVLVCGPAIAQFANPSRHGSTNRMQRSTAGFHVEIAVCHVYPRSKFHRQWVVGQSEGSGHPSSWHQIVNGTEPLSAPQKFSSKW